MLVHVGVLSTNSNSPGRILRPNRLRCVNCLALPIIIISMETIKELYALRRPRLSPTAPSPGANPAYGTTFEGCSGDFPPPSPPAEKAAARQDHSGQSSTDDGGGDRAGARSNRQPRTPFWSHSALRTAAR